MATLQKKKKKRKAYISCKGIHKMDYMKALMMRYNIIFTSDPADADFFIAPLDREGLNERQRRDFKKARSLGLECRLVSSEMLLSNEIEDPLNLDNEELEYKKNKFEKEVSKDGASRDKKYELELG